MSFKLKCVALSHLLYLTPFPLPKNGWLRVPSGLTLEGDCPANSNHLVPRSHHKCWGHCRTGIQMVNHRGGKHTIAQTTVEKISSKASHVQHYLNRILKLFACIQICFGFVLNVYMQNASLLKEYSI